MSYKAGLWARGPGAIWLPGLVHWFDAQRGVTLSNTLRVRGTSPAPTLSSLSSLAQPVPIWSIVQTGGAIGVATVDASSSSGAYRSVLNQLASGALALPGTDLSVGYSGTQVLGDVFQSVVASLTDQIGAAVFASVDQAHSPPLECRGGAGPVANQDIFNNNMPGAGLTGINTVMAQGTLMTTTGIAELATGASWFIAYAGRLTGGLGLGNDAAYVAAANNSAVDATNYFVTGHNGAGGIFMECRNTGNQTTRVVQSSGPATNHSDYVGGVRYNAGTGVFTLFRNGLPVGSGTATGGTLGAINWSRVELLGLRRRPLGTPIDSNQINGMLHCVGFVNRAPSDQEIYDFAQLIMGRYGIFEPVTNGRICIVGASNEKNWPPQTKWGIDALASGSNSTPEIIDFSNPGNPMSGDPNNPADFSGAIGGGQLGQLQTFFQSGAILIQGGCVEVNIGTDGLGDMNVAIANADVWWTKVTGFGYDPNKIILTVFPYATPGPALPITPDFLAKQQQWANYCYSKVPNPRQVVDFRAVPGAPNDNNYFADQQHFAANGSVAAGNLMLPAYSYSAHGGFP